MRHGKLNDLSVVLPIMLHAISTILSVTLYDLTHLSIEEITKERDYGVDGDHDQHPDNVFLLLRAGEISQMFPNQPEGSCTGYQSKESSYDPSNIVG